MVRQKGNKKVMRLVEGEGRRKSGPIMGVDVHKDLLAYCVLTEKKILSELTVKNDLQGIQSLITLCQTHQISSVAVESTAQYHFKLIYGLLEAGIGVLVANPQQTKTTQGKKTDKFDARRIAIAHRDGRLKPSVISSQEILSLRKANRMLFKQINDATKIKPRLNQLFHQKDFQHPNLVKTRSGLQLLQLVAEGLISETTWNSQVPEKLQAWVTPDLRKALQEFQDRLDEIERITFGNEVLQLQFLEISMDRQRMAYYAVAKKNPHFRNLMKLLLRIPGVGPDTAATILAEIADISYFPSPKHLAKWAGLAPRVYQSGHHQHVTGHIHKGGDKYLRRAVVLACQNIYAKGEPHNPLRQFMRSKKIAKDSYWLALCAGARKLLVLIWYILKKQFEWGTSSPSPELLEPIKQVLTEKIKLFQSKVNRYQRIWERLSGDCKEVFERIQGPQQSPKFLLKTLLNSV